jgi:hypothetical protein
MNVNKRGGNGSSKITTSALLCKPYTCYMYLKRLLSHPSGYAIVSDKQIYVFIAVCFNFFFLYPTTIFQDDASSGPSVIRENHTYASSNREAC